MNLKSTPMATSNSVRYFSMVGEIEYFLREVLGRRVRVKDIAEYSGLGQSTLSMWTRNVTTPTSAKSIALLVHFYDIIKSKSPSGEFPEGLQFNAASREADIAILARLRPEILERIELTKDSFAKKEKKKVVIVKGVQDSLDRIEAKLNALAAAWDVKL